MPDKGLVREIDILEKLYTKCYNESKGSSFKMPYRRNKSKGKNMTEAFLPWLDKLQKLYRSKGNSDTDGNSDQEWIKKLKERIVQKKSNEKLNKQLYKCVSIRDSPGTVNNLASNRLSEETLAEVERLLVKGASNDWVDENGMCALLIAAQRNSAKCAELILKKYPEDINRVNTKDQSFLYYDFYNMLRYSHDPMFLKFQGSVLEDFGEENFPKRHSLYQFMLAQIDMRKYKPSYKFDAEKFFHQMEERYGSYESGMNVFRRDTEFFRQRRTFSYQESTEEYVSNEYQNGYGEHAELYGELHEKILQFFRTSKYIDPSNKFELDNHVDIYKVNVVDPESGQLREGYRFLAVLFKNCWIEQRWGHGRIHLDSQGILHFSISEDRQSWIPIPTDTQHPSHVLPQSDLDAIIAYVSKRKSKEVIIDKNSILGIGAQGIVLQRQNQDGKRRAYKLILSRLKQKEYSKFYDRRSYRRKIFHKSHRELPDVKIGGLKHDNIVSYQTRLQTIKCFHLNQILFHVLEMDVYDLNLHKYLDHLAIKRLEKKKDRYHEIVPTRFSILEKIVDALIFLHNKKIWHLDLKPLNIMMNSEWKTDNKRGELWDGQTLKLIDFGISMLDGCFEEDLSMGTPGYGSPEQAAQERIYDNFLDSLKKSDNYSLGKTMIELFVAFGDREKYLNHSMELPDAEHLLMNMQCKYQKEVKEWILNLLRIDSERRWALTDLKKKLGQRKESLGKNMKLFSWPTTLTRDVSVRNPIGDQVGVNPFRRRPSQSTMTSQQTMIKSQGDSNLCASISVSNVLSYALRRYLLEENVIPEQSRKSSWETDIKDHVSLFYNPESILAVLVTCIYPNSTAGLIDTVYGFKIWEKQTQFAEIQSIIQRLVKCTFFERLGWRRFPQLETTLKKLHDIVEIDESDKQKFDDDTNQKKMTLIHEKVKARRSTDWPGMDFEEACLAKHRFVVKLIYGINTDMMVECIRNDDIEQLSQLWNQKQAHAVVGVSVTKNKDGKRMLLVRDSDGPDQAIDLNRPTYEQITQMVFNDATQINGGPLEVKPMEELKLEIKKIQALNIKENDLILCEDGHCLIYKRKVQHRGPAFDNPNAFSIQRGANQDLNAYITQGDYDRTRPQSYN